MSWCIYSRFRSCLQAVKTRASLTTMTLKITEPYSSKLVPINDVPVYTVVRYDGDLYFKGNSTCEKAVGLSSGANFLNVNAGTFVEVVDAELVVKS